MPSLNPYAAGAPSGPPSPVPGSIDLDAVQAVAAGFGHVPGGLLPALHAVQDRFGHIPRDAVPRIAEVFNLSRAEVHGVVTYYHHFRSEPPAAHVLQVCRAESCQAMGGEALLAHAQQRLGCHGAHGRSADGRFTVEPVYCLGLCALSPAAMLDGEPHARLTPAALDAIVDEAASGSGVAP